MRLRTWLRARNRLPIAGTSMSVDEAPLRAQLFTAEEMEQHGRHLAAGHELTRWRSRDRLLRRLGDNEKVLAETCALLAQSADQQRRVTPAGEWLLDNFYLIEEEVRTAKRHLPPGYSRELPRIAGGASAGLPRVYDLALHAVAHGDSRLGRGSLTRFIASYQTVKTLRLGELWAVPIMLRLALIENLRRVAARVAASMAERDLAGLWADRMIEVAERDPKSLILVVADMARSEPAMTAPFVAELSRRLHGRSTALALPLTWVEQHLGESQQTIEQLVKFEAQAQAAAQVSVSNSIGSLRLLASMDWREFVETLSKVEQALRHDPADVYPRMDFATRDSYRHAVERIARHVDADARPRWRAPRCSWRATRRRGRIARPIARMSATTSSTPGRRNWSAPWRCARRSRTACAAPWRAARSPGSPARSSRPRCCSRCCRWRSLRMASPRRSRRCRWAPGSRRSPSPRC